MVLRMTADEFLAQPGAQTVTCLAFPSWLNSHHPGSRARRPRWKGKIKPPSGLRGEHRACHVRLRSAGEYLTPAGFQRAQNLPWIDRTRRHRDGANVVQVPGMDHIGRSRTRKSLPELGRVGPTGIIPRKVEKRTPPISRVYGIAPPYLLKEGYLAPAGRTAKASI